jgi:hypothetical protein
VSTWYTERLRAIGLNDGQIETVLAAGTRRVSSAHLSSYLKTVADELDLKNPITDDDVSHAVASATAIWRAL